MGNVLGDRSYSSVNPLDQVRNGRRLIQGGVISAPTTTSIKTANRANVAPVFGYVGGVRFAFESSADERVDADGVVADEKAVCFALVIALLQNASAPSKVWVKGTEKTFDTSIAVTDPADVTDAQIVAKIGNVPYARCGTFKIGRTSDTTITEAVSHTNRTGFGGGL